MNKYLAATIKSTQGNYPIFVGNDFKKDISTYIKNEFDIKKIFIISDSKVFPTESIGLIN